MKKTLLVALLASVFGMQAQSEEDHVALVLAYGQNPSLNRLNTINEQWKADLNNSGLPWNDRGALHHLFDAMIEYARSGGFDKGQITAFNNAAQEVQKRLESRSKGALVRVLRQSERLSRFKDFLNRLNSAWFKDLSEYTENKAREKRASSADVAFIMGQFPAFERQVRNLEKLAQ